MPVFLTWLRQGEFQWCRRVFLTWLRQGELQWCRRVLGYLAQVRWIYFKIIICIQMWKILSLKLWSSIKNIKIKFAQPDHMESIKFQRESNYANIILRCKNRYYLQVWTYYIYRCEHTLFTGVNILYLQVWTYYIYRCEHTIFSGVNIL